jgi:hypothetical protein
MINTEPIEFGANTANSLFGDLLLNNCRLWNIELNTTNAAIEGIGTSGKPNATPVNIANCITDTCFDDSIFGLDTFSIPDDSGLTLGFKTVNLPLSSRQIQP